MNDFRNGGMAPSATVGRASFSEGLDAQLDQLEHEAGVREQL